MTFKKIKDFVLDNERDLHERLFVLMMFAMILSWIVTLVEILIFGGTFMDIIYLLAGIVLFATVGGLSIKLNRISLGAVIISVGVCGLYMPCTFFFGGGIYGDAPLWFLFGVFFVNMTLRGKAKIVLFIFNVLMASACWFASYYFPALVVQNNVNMAHLYSFIAFILIGVAMSVMISFRNMLYNREVRRSQEQKKEIETLNAAQNRFFSSMSHEIRTPINTIIALNEMILREDISEEVAEDVANIQSASKMLLHLINDILDMSKFASGEMQLAPVSYNPAELLSEVAGMMWIRANEKKLDFRVSVSPDIPSELFGDEVRIKQILINVLNNAIKYTNEGSVELSVQCGENENGVLNVIFTVTDTGIGIKKENIPYLFTAFRRVDEEKNRHIEGTGLGLSIVKQFVDLMGGKITVNSIYTEGSTFIIELPQKVMSEQNIGDVNIDSASATVVRKERVTGFEAPEAKVLVVDDTASNLLVVSKLLRETKVQLDTASSGTEALKKTLNEHYHVIFMDHLMPEMDGIECFRAIREQIGGHCRESKVVILTANADGENRILYEKEGFDGYLAKPISGEDIENELYRLLPKNLTFVVGDKEDILRETISWMKIEQRRKNVVITTESVADLPKELIERYSIVVLPHLVCTTEGNFRDGVEIETDGLLNYMRDVTRKVQTRAPDVRTIEAFFAKMLSGANNVIHISISGKLANSGCIIAKEAAKAFDNVTVIDSGHLSSGHGLLVLEACRLAEEGMSPADIAARLEQVKSKIHTSFVVDNLEFLARAGQVNPKTADLLKSILARPVLRMKKGKLGIDRFYFGTRERTWKRYINAALRNPSGIDKRVLFVTCVGLSKSDMDWIREQIEKKIDVEDLYFQKASPVIAVNCGAGTFGLLMRDAERN